MPEGFQSGLAVADFHGSSPESRAIWRRLRANYTAYDDALSGAARTAKAHTRAAVLREDSIRVSCGHCLGVSRPFLVKLVEEGDVRFHMVGSHRRIYLRDLLKYKRRCDSARHEAINEGARVEMEAGTCDEVILPERAEDE